MSERRSVTLSLEPAVYAGLEKRAQAMGRKVADFARMLFDAAYSARVSRERGAPATDVELDAAVRAVFCLAGELKPREIAKATGFSVDMVDNILRGFAEVAGETRNPVAKASEDNGRTSGEAAPVTGEASRAHGPDHAGGTPPLIGVTGGESAATSFDRAAYVRPEKERTPSSFTAEDLAFLRVAYAAEDTIGAIARAMNCTRGALEMFLNKRRAEFPPRRVSTPKRKISP